MFTKKKTLSQILTGFDQTLSELEQLKVRNDSDVQIKAERVSTLQKEITELDGESKEAEKVAANLRKLLGR